MQVTEIEDLRARGVESLDWYTPESSADFLSSIEQAREVAEALLWRWEQHHETSSLRGIIAQDHRTNRGRSAMYLYLLRTALVNNYMEIAVILSDVVDTGILLDSVDADYDAIEATIPQYPASTAKNAYATMLLHLANSPDDAVGALLAAFITLKISLDDDVSVQGAAVALSASRDYNDYTLVGDYTRVWGQDGRRDDPRQPST